MCCAAGTSPCSRISDGQASSCSWQEHPCSWQASGSCLVSSHQVVRSSCHDAEPETRGRSNLRNSSYGARSSTCCRTSLPEPPVSGWLSITALKWSAGIVVVSMPGTRARLRSGRSGRSRWLIVSICCRILSNHRAAAHPRAPACQVAIHGDWQDG